MSIVQVINERKSNGKTIKLSEIKNAESGMITHYLVTEQEPEDSVEQAVFSCDRHYNQAYHRFVTLR